jgi:hypothetical protein
MVLIPPDAGIRMRMQTETDLLQPVQPVRQLPSDLPELQPGQAFQARITEALPDNTYRALVAGRQLTLQLPEGANPGDTLDLVLVDRTGKTLIAQRTDAGTNAANAGAAYEHANISRTGQMISRLLLPEGESPQPAPLNRGQPLLTQAPASAAELAPTLAKAVSQSGLFYEAHPAEWVAGRRPAEFLHAEPQAQVPLPTQAAAATAKAATAESTMQAAAAQASGDAKAAGNESLSRQAANTAQAIPEPLRPLVQQQLDAIATQRLVWHGEVWPGQSMELQIERERVEERETDAAAATEADRWNTSLRLALPRLGTIGAELNLSGGKLRLRLSVGSEAATADLRAAADTLTGSLTDAGIAVQSLDIRHETE